MWSPLKGAHQCVSGQWDIKNSSIACLVKRQGFDSEYKIGLFNLPEFALTNEVEFISSKNAQAHLVLFRLSPDEKKIAVLQMYSNTPNQEHNGECFRVPDKYKLSIHSTDDSSILFESLIVLDSIN